MAKTKLILKNNLTDIDIKGLKDLRDDYIYLLKKNLFPPILDFTDTIAVIKYFKRRDELNPIKIGPYENITPFEAANRIASDLVIINGLLQLVATNEKFKNATFTLRLGTTHIKDKGDFTIKLDNNEFEGEAFNVAESFYKAKLRSTISKWKDKDLQYILVNGEVVLPDDIKALKEINVQLIPVQIWHH